MLCIVNILHIYIYGTDGLCLFVCPPSQEQFGGPPNHFGGSPEHFAGPPEHLRSVIGRRGRNFLQVTSTYYAMPFLTLAVPCLVSTSMNLRLTILKVFRLIFKHIPVLSEKENILNLWQLTNQSPWITCLRTIWIGKKTNILRRVYFLRHSFIIPLLLCSYEKMLTVSP